MSAITSMPAAGAAACQARTARQGCTRSGRQGTAIFMLIETRRPAWKIFQIIYLGNRGAALVRVKTTCWQFAQKVSCELLFSSRDDVQ
ncbi:hypothetical protein [Burkholderia glumae]|uniref:Uncharacterized protein n=2 Tax=Burkholderia glumae TaxID=337 RepID=A0AAQ0BQQ1_BURGL|nr:hypothetical protein [Burkholderia glumae]MCM2494920.1 hypothetical protein [Burkholderia glumae]MCM2539997.1 hypothetical protein [Burkholderia glumae]MCM2545785.1 hypothetical protein [Burkholderia glumae]MCM2551595.1 hypothetical protein [Burkholderia glumae]MCQ0030899.1 hypothetical protein [Burkholderia glumae]